MPKPLHDFCRWAFTSWSDATLTDYAFAMAWVILVGYLISKLTSFSTK